MAKSKAQQASSRKRKGSKKNAANAVWAIPRNIQQAGNAGMTHFKTILTYPLGVTAFQGNALGVAYGANGIVLQALTGYANYTAIFDSYRIDAVEWKFTLRDAGSSNMYPNVILYPDWDDATAPTTIGDAQSHVRAVTHVLTPLKPSCTLAIVPKVAVATYQGAFTGYGANDKPMWIDCSSSNVAHYGCKWGIWNFTDTSQFIDLSVKVWISFREPV